MRITSDLFVSALTRRIFSAGGYAAIERKGASEAGAIFIRQRRRDGRETLYGPAPQSFFDSEDSSERRFERRVTDGEPDACAEVIAREMRFDPDLWLVEIEVEEIGDLFSVAESDAQG